MIRVGQKQGCCVAMMSAVVLVMSMLALVTISITAHSKGKPPPRDGVTWTKVGTVAGVTGNYTAPVLGSQLCIYSNFDGVTDGSLFRRCGTWASVGPAQLVFSTPTGSPDAFIRTLGVTRGASGKLYAVLYVGPCYGCTGGFSPALATSADDGLTWTYFGRFSPFGINQSSAAALIVDESRADAYACMAWLDIGPALYLMHAPMPCSSNQWTSDGVNQWPIAGEQAQFVTAAKTQYGYHLIGAIGFPATALRHVFSCTGLPPWRVIEMASDVINTSVGKGTNLAYDGATNLLHALTSGVHWQMTARAFPC